MIKLIASDVDGTLIPEGSSGLHPDFAGVIRELKKKGIVFVAASGRPYQSARNVFSEVEQEVYFITNNGGMICYQGKRLDVQVITGEDVREVLEFFRTQKNVFYVITTVEQDYTECQDEEMITWLREGYHLKIDVVPDLMEIKEGVIKMAIFYKKQDALEMAKQIRLLMPDSTTVLASGAHWVDVVHQDAQKGRALQKLQKEWGITKEETMAFGDNDNDISLLLAAEESYAVSDARESVKEICKYVLADTTKETVLKEIKKLL